MITKKDRQRLTQQWYIGSRRLGEAAFNTDMLVVSGARPMQKMHPHIHTSKAKLLLVLTTKRA